MSGRIRLILEDIGGALRYQDPWPRWLRAHYKRVKARSGDAEGFWIFIADLDRDYRIWRAAQRPGGCCEIDHDQAIQAVRRIERIRWSREEDRPVSIKVDSEVLRPPLIENPRRAIENPHPALSLINFT